MAVEVPLVLEIEKHECLYNFNLPEYNRKDTLDYAWASISAAVNLSVHECKDKWKNIRSSFVRSVKGSKTSKPYYLSKYLQFIIPYIKPKSIEEHNIIVTDHINSNDNGTDGNESDDVTTIKEEPTSVETAFEEAPTFTSVIEEEPPNNTEAIHQHDPIDTVQIKRKRRRHQFIPTENEAPRQKNKRLYPKSGNRSDNTAMKYFLLSLLPEIDTMDEEQSRQFKIKVMMLIDEIKSIKTKNHQKLSPQFESERVQKRLINLLIKNLKSK